MLNDTLRHPTFDAIPTAIPSTFDAPTAFPSFVYIMVEPEGGFVKVGLTDSPVDRLKNIKCQLYRYHAVWRYESRQAAAAVEKTVIYVFRNFLKEDMRLKKDGSTECFQPTTVLDDIVRWIRQFTLPEIFVLPDNEVTEQFVNLSLGP